MVRPMASSRDPEPSLRRRITVASPADPVFGTIPAAVDSTTDSGDDSVVDTTSDPDLTDGVVNGDQGEEKKNLASVSEGADDRSGAEGGVPPMFLYRASAPAHRRMKESPLSSDAIFKQVGFLWDSVFLLVSCYC